MRPENFLGTFPGRNSFCLSRRKGFPHMLRNTHHLDSSTGARTFVNAEQQTLIRLPDSGSQCLSASVPLACCSQPFSADQDS